MRISLSQVTLLFILTPLFLSCSSKREEVYQQLKGLNEIKEKVDALDSLVEFSYEKNYLKVSNGLEPLGYDTLSFQRFIQDSDSKYDGLQIKIDSIKKLSGNNDVIESLEAIIGYQKKGLDDYFTYVINLNEIDTLIDIQYNDKFQKLDNAYYEAQLKFAEKYKIDITTINK